MHALHALASCAGNRAPQRTAVIAEALRVCSRTQANQRRVARVSKEIERNIGNLFLYDKARSVHAAVV